MLLIEIVDKLIRSVSGGVNPNDSKFDPLYVQALIPQLREKAIKMDYSGTRDMAANKRIEYAWLQSELLNIDEEIQDPDVDYLIFSLPKPVAISKGVDGIVYAGKKDDSVDFSKLANRNEVALYKRRGFLRNGKDIAVIYETPYLLVFGNPNLKQVKIQGVFSDPTRVANFNQDTDDYPVTDSLLDVMTDLFKKEQGININKPADSVNDGADTLSKGIISQNTKA
jgi:hypothetical protein